ncbi:FAD-dependent oxidoreductase [Nonomuraea terrae]|uniref:FAD-dependent oxidoreductase n=1 Tax=Nonomuraea terrae TaxID=2530383 RepID=A0A4R4Z6I7_9ACTN|nr:NAD(P)/FAD-dependent oxidoreductase [Nonomuraea terrae]TDD53536.1 FAD-dependent oxidoreductase [Nonomuraea terrae]
MNAENHDVVIVGGGVAGLSALWQLRHRDVVLLEADERLGGRLMSLPRGDYWMNLGAHLFPGAGSHVERMTSGLGLETIGIPGAKFALAFAGKVYANKRVETYPFTLPLSLSERVALAGVGLRAVGAVKAWQDTQREQPGWPARRFGGYLANRSFRDLIGRPPARVDGIFRAAGHRAASELEDQSAATGGALFGGVWAGRKSLLSYNLDGGSSRLGEAMAAELGHLVRYGATVTRVREEDGRVLVTLRENGEERTLRARQVIMATPAYISHRVVEGLPGDVAGVLADVRYGPFVSAGVITTERGPMPYDRIYALTATDQSFDMMFNHANPLRTGVRRPGGSLMVYAGGDGARRMLDLEDSGVESRYADDLASVFPQLRGNLGEIRIQRWEHGIPYRRPGFSFEPMLRYSRRTDVGVHFCGDYFADLGNMELAAASGFRAAVRAGAAVGGRP